MCIVAAMAIGDEGWSETFLLGAPFALVPSMILLEPRVGRSATVTGLVGAIGFVGALGGTVAHSAGAAVPEVLIVALVGASSLMGVWMVLAGLSRARRRTMPSGLAAMATIAGLCFTFGVIASAVDAVVPQDVTTTLGSPALWAVVAPSWLLSHAVFSGWLAVWLWRSAAPHQSTITIELS